MEADQLSFDYLKESSPDDKDFYKEMLELFIKGLVEGHQEIELAGEKEEWLTLPGGSTSNVIAL